MDTIAKLLAAAQGAKEKAYAPYSRIPAKSIPGAMSKIPLMV